MQMYACSTLTVQQNGRFTRYWSYHALHTLYILWLKHFKLSISSSVLTWITVKIFRRKHGPQPCILHQTIWGIGESKLFLEVFICKNQPTQPRTFKLSLEHSRKTEFHRSAFEANRSRGFELRSGIQTNRQTEITTLYRNIL